MIFPSITKAFKSFFKAAWYLLRNGRIQISETDRAARESVCMACPHYRRISKHSLMGQCAICTCIVQAKVKLLSEECPKDLWIV